MQVSGTRNTNNREGNHKMLYGKRTRSWEPGGFTTSVNGKFREQICFLFAFPNYISDSLMTCNIIEQFSIRGM